MRGAQQSDAAATSRDAHASRGVPAAWAAGGLPLSLFGVRRGVPCSWRPRPSRCISSHSFLLYPGSRCTRAM